MTHHNQKLQLQHQLIVDFPIRHRQKKEVRFASHATEQPIISVLTVCHDKQELWYSRDDITMMRLERDRDAHALAQTLMSPSETVLREGGIDISQAVGLEKSVNPIARRRACKNIILQKRAVLRLQGQVQDEDELRCVSEHFSRASSERAHTLAVQWMVLDRLDQDKK